MRKATKKSKVHRIISLVLACVMVLTMLSPASVEAAEGSISTDKDTYVVGEPIIVTASSSSDDDRVGIYTKDDEENGSYWYWFYTDGNAHNIYDTEWKEGNAVYDGSFLPVGEYVLRVEKANVSTEITIVEPEDTTSALIVENDTVAFGEPLRVKPTSYKSASWVGIYTGTLKSEEEFEATTALSWRYVNGTNNTYTEFNVPAPGDYTVLLTADGGYTIDKIKYVTVEEAKVELLTTDKEEYKFGEPIMVTTNYASTEGWVGLYKKDDVPGDGPGTVTSMFYEYIQNEPYNLIERNPQRSDEFVGGEYKVVLFADGGYTDIATKYITITAEIDESKTVKTEPTCEEDGSIVYTYTDGTTETEILKAIGHAYPDEWTYDGDVARTHSKKCANDSEHVQTEKCTFNDGVITKEPTTTENGEKTYTCTGCNGTYTETISAKKPVGTKVIKEATCEEDGTLRTYYDKVDGDDYIDTVILKTGHAYPENWTYDAETKKHSKVCGNDAAHVQTEACKFTKEVKDGKFVYTCGTCNGSYEESVIRTDKKKYDIDEAINVTVDYDYKNMDWVGIFKKGEVPGGAEISFYYYYPSERGKTFNIYDSTPQRGEVEPGEYTLYLCADNGYDVICSVDITIGHEFGEWKYDADTKTHSRTCDGSMRHTEGPVVCTFESEVTKKPTATETGIETFTCTECGGSYEEVLPKTSSTIVDTVTIDPTCETDGKIIFTYSDGTVKEEVIEKLGHDYDEENYTFNEVDKTHSCVCKNDSSHVKTMNCNFNRIAMDGDKATYKCTVCGGTFEDGLLVVSKDTYSASEDINVIASCDSNDSWVGLYKVDDEYGSVVSYYWYYVVSSGINRDGKTVNLTDKAFYNVERLDSMTPGEYKIVLFGDGGYDKIIAEKTITITEVSTTYDMKINGKEVSDGDLLQFKDDDAVNVTVTANGNPGTSWVGIYTAHYTKDTDFKGIGTADFFWLSENNGKTVNLKESLREPGDYCLVIFGDHGHDYVKKIVYYTFTKDGAEKILIEPTCTKPGIKYVKYDDGSDAYVPIAKLGHDVKTWTYDDETKTHSGICERVIGDKTCDKTVKEECQFDIVENEAGGKTYTCTVCNGQYTDTVIPYEEENDRIYGETRYETATKIADQLKKEQAVEKFNNIIIASGTGYADALSGTYLAKVKDAPILLVNSKSTESMKKVAEYVNDNLAKDGTVYILGGKAAISDTFKSYLKMDSAHIKRLGGATRYETNLLILKEAGVTGGEILVCTGNNFADSLSASAVGRPILLTNNKALSTAQKTFLKGMKDAKYFIIGGENAISYDMADSIRDFGGTERISGETRYETSIKIAKKFIDSPKSMVLAYGKDFPDGLAGGMLALNMDAPLILITDNYKDSAVDYAKDNNITSGKVLGGTIRISEAVAKEVFGVVEDK